jgi:hypothetical protein
MARTNAFRHTVKLMYLNGESLKYIANAKNISIKEVLDIIEDFNAIYIGNKKSTHILGSKREPYYASEDEMLNTPVYNFKDLSKLEQLFYESWVDKQTHI